LELKSDEAVAFRLAAMGLDRRRSVRSIARAATTALPDYPRGAAARALAARCDGVDAETLPEALAKGTLVRSLSLRRTTHVFAADDNAVYTVGTLPTQAKKAEADKVARITDEIADVMSDRVARSRGALSEALHGRVPAGWEPWCARCKADHVPDDLFRLAVVTAGLRFAGDGTELTVGDRPDLSDEAAVTEARSELVRRFLHAYAPAPSRSFAEWCGIEPSEARESFSALGDEIVDVRLDGKKAAALDADIQALGDATAGAVEGVRLIPAGDAFLQQRDRATLIADGDHRKKLWKPAGAPGLVLVDGMAAGVWRQKQAKDHLDVTAELWTGKRTDKRLSSALHDEAVALAAADPATTEAAAADDVEVTIN
jgi:hypothetical protein